MLPLATLRTFSWLLRRDSAAIGLTSLDSNTTVTTPIDRVFGFFAFVVAKAVLAAAAEETVVGSASATVLVDMQARAVGRIVARSVRGRRNGTCMIDCRVEVK